MFLLGQGFVRTSRSLVFLAPNTVVFSLAKPVQVAVFVTVLTLNNCIGVYASVVNGSVTVRHIHLIDSDPLFMVIIDSGLGQRFLVKDTIPVEDLTIGYGAGTPSFSIDLNKVQVFVQ